MIYPYNIQTQSAQIASLLGDSDWGTPYLFDFSKNNSDLLKMDIDDQVAFQNYIEKTLEEKGARWGMAGYMENRESLLRNLPQMVQEKRFFHLGLDIILPEKSVLHMPIEGVVMEEGYEEGEGNFGGYMLVKHSISDTPFYSLWGHLSPHSFPGSGTLIKRGEPFCELGNMNENGNWFYHTHLQILTEKGLEEGYLSKGYCQKEMIEFMDQICPSPLFLLRY